MRHIMVVLVLAALTVAGCGGGGAAQQAPSASPAAQAPAAGGNVVVVKMSEFKFEMPAELPAGRVTFQVENVGAVEHSFIVEELGIKTDQLRPRQTVTINADVKPGRYKAICDVAGHPEAGMTLELTVRE